MPAVIDEERCKGCGVCIDACPRDILKFSGTLNQKGYAPATCTDAAMCTACAMCAIMCPDVAIEVFRKGEAHA